MYLYKFEKDFICSYKKFVNITKKIKKKTFDWSNTLVFNLMAIYYYP